MQDALTVRPPHVLLLPHPSFDADKLSMLIERLEVTSDTQYAAFIHLSTGR